MNFNEYRPLALRTAKPLPTPTENLQHAALGLITEIGEFTTEVKRIVIYERVMTAEMNAHMQEELGDACWYVPVAMLGLGVESLPLAHAAQQTSLADISMTLALLTGEVIAAVTLGDGAQRSSAHFAKKLATIVALIDQAAVMLGTTGDELRAANIEKLRKRYPDAYSNTAAEARADKEGLPATQS
jgi:NTP pyrophosphatase (non-canonical NTP hydrolase)